MMTRADFEALALALRMSPDVNTAMVRVADVCQRSNERFDRLRFYKAVKGEAEPEPENPEFAVVHLSTSVLVPAHPDSEPRDYINSAVDTLAEMLGEGMPADAFAASAEWDRP